MSSEPASKISFSRAPRARGGSALFIFSLALALLVALSMTPAPYVIAKPGPVYDTLGKVHISGTAEEVPLISLVDVPTFPTEGNLNLLTVSQYGNPEQRPRWIDLVFAWFNQENSIYDLSRIYPEGISTETIVESNRLEMENSQQQAIAAALSFQGYEFTSSYFIHSLIEGSPAEGKLEADDELISVNSVPIESVEQLRTILEAAGETAVEVKVRRASKEISVQVVPKLRDNSYALYVMLQNRFVFPVQIQIQLERVGGPSAGLMFALGIIDKMTEESLTGGKNIAGTGTIDAQGEVGAIGGVPQKLYGALHAGAELFLLPADNCPDLPETIPAGITPVPVSTLRQAHQVLSEFAKGVAADQLPHC